MRIPKRVGHLVPVNVTLIYSVAMLMHICLNEFYLIIHLDYLPQAGNTYYASFIAFTAFCTIGLFNVVTGNCGMKYLRDWRVGLQENPWKSRYFWRVFFFLQFGHDHICSQYQSEYDIFECVLYMLTCDMTQIISSLKHDRIWYGISTTSGFRSLKHPDTDPGQYSFFKNSSMA